MKFREWFSPPRRLLALFLTVILVPAAALVWLGWRVLEQDRTVEAQRLQERLEAAADRATDALIRRLKELESIPMFDYVVVNRQGEIQGAIEAINAIITAEKCRAVPRDLHI